MTQVEDYTAKAAASLAAALIATNARDRAFHHRAHGVWKRMIVNLAQSEERAALNPPGSAKRR